MRSLFHLRQIGCDTIMFVGFLVSREGWKRHSHSYMFHNLCRLQQVGLHTGTCVEGEVMC